MVSSLASEGEKEHEADAVPIHLGVEAYTTGEESVLEAHAGFRYAVTGRFGMQAAFRATTHEDGFAESYVGPYVTLGVVTLGVGLGLEAVPERASWRAAVTCELEYRRLHASAAVEDGGSGYWYHVFADYQLAKPLSVGVFAQRHDGLGPLIDLHLGHTVQLWTALPVYNFEHEHGRNGFGVISGLDVRF